jgi:hypothetical protein
VRLRRAAGSSTSVASHTRRRLPTATAGIRASMLVRSRTLVLAAVAAVAANTAAPASARAQFTVYTSLDAWLAAVSAPGLDTFDDLGAGSFPSPTTRTAGSYSYRAGTSGGDFFMIGTQSDRWLSTDNSADLVFDDFSPTVRGVGGFFFPTNYDGDVIDGSLVLTAVGAGGTTTVTLTNTGATSFWGVVSSGAITSLTVAPVIAGDGVWSTVNDLRLGAAVAPVNVVPEPSTYALFATGVAGVGLIARRRRGATTG